MANEVLNKVLDPIARVCGNCAHARDPVIHPSWLTKVITCKAGPPSAVGVPVRDAKTGAIGMEVHGKWPVLPETESCDAFLASNSGLNGAN